MQKIKIILISFTLLSTLIGCKEEKESTIKSELINQEKIQLDALFEKGDNDYACFRIPAVVVTNKGSILAFAEARKNGCSDTGNIDLVMRKSTDNGKTWSPIKTIWDDGNNVCGNPAPVVDKETGDIHLLTTWNNGDDYEPRIIDGTSKGTREVFHFYSNNDGDDWTVPKKITKSVKLPNWTWYATGPVHGIQLEKGQHKGRLVIPCDYFEAKTKNKYSHVIYSDNHGKTWEIGGVAPKHGVNESTVVELENGELLFNMRNYNRDSIKGRQIATSNDGGSSWQNQYIEKQLPEPVCQGALLNIARNGENVLLFTNPSSNTSRTNMMISISRDQGKSWNEKISIYKKHAAYSDLAELNNREIFVLFEAGIKNAYDGIYYKTVQVD